MIIYFGIGTNIGNREANLQEALRRLDELVGEQLACSEVYHSAPQGFVSDNEFANIVAVYETPLSPEELLLLTQHIERDMGRTKKSVNGVYHDRIIDIDLLQVIQNSQLLIQNSPNLQLPHPRMHEREFVMVPMQEVDRMLNIRK
jgi:2-amino-4-hydroxy-6-hydroxymethyldihydropteridine diphosphokinase